jgi:hypothetical protein
MFFELYIQGDYKWCERLHKFIGKKVTARQKLSAHYSKEQVKKDFSPRMRIGMSLIFCGDYLLTNKFI